MACLVAQEKGEKEKDFESCILLCSWFKVVVLLTDLAGFEVHWS